MTCPVCDGRGWLTAAPMEVVAVWIGSNPTPEHMSVAAWDHAAATPCFSCYPSNLKVVA